METTLNPLASPIAWMPTMTTINSIKIRDLYEDYLAFRAKEGNCMKTLNEHRRFLEGPINDALGFRNLSEITLMARADLIEAGKRYGIYGSQRAVVYFRQLLQYARIAGLNPPVDWRDFKTPKVPAKRVEYLSPAELQQIRECFPVNDRTDLAALRSRVLIEFMLGTGLRIGEACSVNVDHINFDTREMWFVNIKTKEEETLILNDNVIEWIKIYLTARDAASMRKGRSDDCPALFLSGRARLMPCTSRNYIRKMTKHLSLNKRVAHHVFRRTCGTYLLQEGTDIKAVQDYLRHKSERTTLRYYIGTQKENRRDIAGRVIGKFVTAPASL